jgi:hypothetical protein
MAIAIGIPKPSEKKCDLEQAHVVAEIAVTWLALSFSDMALFALPAQLVSGATELSNPR